MAEITKSNSRVYFLYRIFFWIIYTLSTKRQAKTPEIGWIMPEVIARSAAGVYVLWYVLQSVVVKIVSSKNRFARFCGVVTTIVVKGKTSMSRVPIFAHLEERLKPWRMLM